VEALPDILPFMIPILGILLGFVVIAGIFIVRPIVEALTKLSENPNSSFNARAAFDGQLYDLSRRVEEIEKSLERLHEVHRFERELAEGRSSAPAPGSSEVTPPGGSPSGGPGSG
jgi:hypothetical protein